MTKPGQRKKGRGATTLAYPTDWPAGKVEPRLVEDLRPFERNARTHSDEQVEQVVRSIQEWGWTVPVLVDEHDTIVAGHCRVLAAKKLEVDSIPVVVARGWSKAKVRAYVIADNKIAESDRLEIEVELTKTL